MDFLVQGKVGDTEVNLEGSSIRLTIMQQDGKRHVISSVLYGVVRRRLVIFRINDEMNKTALIRVTERGK